MSNFLGGREGKLISNSLFLISIREADSSDLGVARLTLDCDGVVRSCLEGGLAYFHSSLSDDSKSGIATAGDPATGKRASLVCPRHGSCMVTTRATTCRERYLENWIA